MPVNMYYIKSCLLNESRIDFIHFIRTQHIECKRVFDMLFIKEIKKMILNEEDECIRCWISEQCKSHFEILDRLEVLDYWYTVEKTKHTKLSKLKWIAKKNLKTLKNIKRLQKQTLD